MDFQYYSALDVFHHILEPDSTIEAFINPPTKCIDMGLIFSPGSLLTCPFYPPVSYFSLQLHLMGRLPFKFSLDSYFVRAQD